MIAARPLLCAVVVHWGNARALRALVAAWERDPAWELVVVDQEGTAGDLPTWVHVVRPGRNLGFSGGTNLGVAACTAPLVLLLNPDATPERGALRELLAGFAASPEAAGLVPRLLYPDGRPQAQWQLRPLPRLRDLFAQTWLLSRPRGLRREPPAKTPIAQPAAAALAVRRAALEALGGVDEGFYPAWFEDVDLARRAGAAGMRFLYWPEACFRHDVGSSVPALGYRAFLWLYYRNLLRYAARHHGRTAAAGLRWQLCVSPMVRLATLPLRCPRRARSRREAARGLLALALGAASGFRRPRDLAERWRAPAPGSMGAEPQ